MFNWLVIVFKAYVTACRLDLVLYVGQSNFSCLLCLSPALIGLIITEYVIYFIPYGRRSFHTFDAIKQGLDLALHLEQVIWFSLLSILRPV